MFLAQDQDRMQAQQKLSPQRKWRKNIKRAWQTN